MKNFALLFLLFCLVFSSSVFAQNRSTAIGVTVGSPNGITGRTWLNDENSFDYGAGWSVMDSKQFEVYSDYLWSRNGIFELNEEKFDFFFGGGLVLRTNSGNTGSDLVFGPRLPVGVSYEFSQPDLELFALFALNVGVIPSSDLFVDLHVGARFYLF